MKKVTLLLLTIFHLATQAQIDNYSVKFDGVDDKIGIYMDKIDQWTVEAWVKRASTAWSAYHSIVGNDAFEPVGRIWEEYPLILNNGRPGVYGANLYAGSALDAQWHHIASTCDGTTTKVYVDGVEVASKTYAKPTSPNFIGSSNRSNFFKGNIDEVRIWNKAISGNEINSWKGKLIDPSHPSYDNLIAYYPFDDQHADATDMKGNNQGDLKNNDYYEPTADDPYYELANNPNFSIPEKDMVHLNSEVIQNDWQVENTNQTVEILKLKVCVQGSQNALKLNELNLDLKGTTALTDIDNIRVYYLGSEADNTNKIELFGGAMTPSNTLSFSSAIGASQPLQNGANYFEVAFDINTNSEVGNLLDAEITSIQLSGSTITPGQSKSVGARNIISSENDPNIVRALAFNIWHGGRETGFDVGVQRTIDIIKESKADIIFMVESYGAQQTIANALGYNIYNRGTNLSIITRFPIIEEYNPVYGSFKAVGAKVKLDNDREVILYDVWLAYSSPDYSSDYRRSDPTPDVWVNGDRRTTVPDINGILSRDVKPNATDPSIPILIGGDFNSASHLDWTDATKSLHEGVGAVNWPVHKIMINDEGYTDSYRTVHPNPLTHQGSTWATIYNWSNNLRIDYIYHKGPNVVPLASEVISSHPTAGVMWPGDHDAVLTTYDFSDNANPVANFTANTTLIQEGETVEFSDISLNNPVSWNWTFEGGTPSTSTDQNPTVKYDKPGIYKVTLTVTNAVGASHTKTIEQYITVKDLSSGCTAKPYSSGTAYNTDDVVSYDGRKYRAKWWTRGDTPGGSSNSGVWEDIGICLVTGTEIIEGEKFFQVYPNPFTDQLTVKSKKGKITTIRIYGINGKLIAQHTCNQENEILQLKEIKAGTYFIKASSDLGDHWQKVIKK